jgi:hypothetical protein
MNGLKSKDEKVSALRSNNPPKQGRNHKYRLASPVVFLAVRMLLSVPCIYMSFATTVGNFTSNAFQSMFHM